MGLCFEYSLKNVINSGNDYETAKQHTGQSCQCEASRVAGPSEDKSCSAGRLPHSTTNLLYVDVFAIAVLGLTALNLLMD